MRRGFLFVGVALLLLAPGGASGAPECGARPQDGCGLTRDTVFEPGRYELPTGIYIGAHGVVLDCAGALLNGTLHPDTAGVRVEGWTGAVVKNCRVENYWDGVLLRLTEDDTVSGNTLRGNRVAIAVEKTRRARVEGNNATGNLWHGVSLLDSQDAVVQGNNLSGNLNGIYLSRSSNATLSDNTLRGNNRTGAHLIGSPGNRLVSNRARDNRQDGFRLESSPSNLLACNTLCGNPRGPWRGTDGSNLSENRCDGPGCAFTCAQEPRCTLDSPRAGSAAMTPPPAAPVPPASPGRGTPRPPGFEAIGALAALLLTAWWRRR